MIEDQNSKDKAYLKRLIEIFGENFVNFIQSESNLNITLEEAKNYYQKLCAIREFYNANLEYILATFNKSKFRWISVYPTDWSKLFTPIEFQAWASIRGIGRIVLYPQFPVGKYFIDFANPGLKVGLEIDGKEFHDKEKDRKRDLELLKLGWTIYRISGSKMNKTNFTTLNDIDYTFYTEQEIYDALSYWLLETGDGIIQAIKEIHFKDEVHDDEDLAAEQFEENNFDDSWLETFRIYQRLCLKSLELNKLV